MNSHRIWRALVGLASTLIGLSYFSLIIARGLAADGQMVHGLLFLAAGVGLLYQSLNPTSKESQMANPFTEEQLVQYNLACDLIGSEVALKSREIHEEENRSSPDERRIARLIQEQSDLQDKRSEIRIEDSETVKRVIDDYRAQQRPVHQG